MEGYYKMDLKKIRARMWGGFIWLMIWPRGRLGSNIFLDTLFIHEHTKYS
jgi:hypothetical protein